MGDFLLLASFLLTLIVVIGFLNEKFLHLTNEIALLLFSAVLGCVITILWARLDNESVRTFLENVQIFNLEDYLMKGVLCFMLFAGARNLKLREFARNARNVSVMAFLCTFLGAVFYGLLFFAVSVVLQLGFTFPMCLMMGSIVAPTDPIAATSILKKFGLPKETGFLMEAESLLNDGVGVALFVCFSGMVTASKSENFVLLMLQEILGAVVVGTAVSLVCFLVFLRTESVQLQFYVTLMAVALSFYLSDRFGFSGAISCVAAGICYSSIREGKAAKSEKTPGITVPVPDYKELNSFWETTDVLLNSLLYVMMGLTFVRIVMMPKVGVLSILAIVLNTVCRFGSVWAGTWLMGKLPDGYDRNRFSILFTWGGLKGGLLVALAMSTSGMVSETQYYIILGCVYAIAVFTTVVQGLSVKAVYNRISAKSAES